DSERVTFHFVLTPDLDILRDDSEMSTGMTSFCSRLRYFRNPRRHAVTLLALVWISLTCSCHRNEVGSAEIRDAAQKGDLAKVQTLLRSHPDLVFSKDNKGDTPLHWAAARD